LDLKQVIEKSKAGAWSNQLPTFFQFISRKLRPPSPPRPAVIDQKKYRMSIRKMSSSNSKQLQQFAVPGRNLMTSLGASFEQSAASLAAVLHEAPTDR
jgi:hypothetical protein